MMKNFFNTLLRVLGEQAHYLFDATKNVKTNKFNNIHSNCYCVDRCYVIRIKRFFI